MPSGNRVEDWPDCSADAVGSALEDGDWAAGTNKATLTLRQKETMDLSDLRITSIMGDFQSGFVTVTSDKVRHHRVIPIAETAISARAIAASARRV